MSRRAVLAAAFTVGASFTLLTGCASDTGSPERSAAPASPQPTSPAPAPSKTPTTEAAEKEQTAKRPIVIPPCEELLSLEEAREGANAPTFEFMGSSEKHKELAYSESFGPVAIDAMESAETVIQCNWGYPNSDGIATVFVAELPSEKREHLVTSLRDSVFTERASDGAVIFEDLDPERRKSLQVRYGFVGDVWVANIGSVSLFEPVLQRMIELNPDQVA